MADMIDRKAAIAEMLKHAKGTTVIGGQTFRTIKLEDALDAIAALPAQGVKPDRETFDAMCAMRNSINEHIPMPSLESDLLQGPDNSVFCATVAEAVIAEVLRLRSRLAALAPAEAGGVEAVTKDAQAFDDMSRVADIWMRKYEEAKQERDDAMALANETIRQLQAAKSELRNVEFGLADPVAVHINMLRGTIAKPTVGQIVHLYGVDALVKALAPVIVREAGGVEAPAKDATAKGETPGQMLDRLGIDGVKWAAEFRTTALRLGYSDMDEGWLIGWFCNAIMAGYDRAPAPAPVDALVKAAEPDYCYDDEWEYTLPWGDRDSLVEYADLTKPVPIYTLIKGPTKWAVNVPIDTHGDGEADDFEVMWFDSEDAALATIREARNG